MPSSRLFQFENVQHERLFRRLALRLPFFEGLPLIIGCASGLRDRHGAVHAGAFIRTRAILFNCTRAEFPRVFVHEVFHFAWLRAGNPRRWSFEDLLRGEWRAGTPGELGWSAQWRKDRLEARDPESRTRRWREYCCESFCDTAAWIYSGLRDHEEFTLRRRHRSRRADWFRGTFGNGPVSI